MLLYVPQIYLCCCRFVDRDMFVRFMGCGIGHKGQSHCVPSSNEVGNACFLEEDDLDSHNIARIIHEQTVQPVTDIDDGKDDHNTQDDMDSLSTTGDSDTDSDGDDDLDGHF